MSRKRLAPVRVLGCFPRVSGDEPMQQRELTLDTLFSPRERG